MSYILPLTLTVTHPQLHRFPVSHSQRSQDSASASQPARFMLPDGGWQAGRTPLSTTALCPAAMSEDRHPHCCLPVCPSSHTAATQGLTRPPPYLGLSLFSIPHREAGQRPSQLPIHPSSQVEARSTPSGCVWLHYSLNVLDLQGPLTHCFLNPSLEGICTFAMMCGHRVAWLAGLDDV